MNDKTFEENMKRLEEIKNELENPNNSLDKMLELYKEAQEIIKVQIDKINNAKSLIEEYK